MPKNLGETKDDVGQTVSLSLAILERLAISDSELGVTALAVALGTSKSRIHRHLQTLLAHGYVGQSDPSEKYTIGARLIMLGCRIAATYDLGQVSRRTMIALRETLGHTVVLSLHESDGNRVIATITGKSAIEINVKPKTLLAFHATAQGKISLAFGDRAFCDGVLSGPLEPWTPSTKTSVADLVAELELIRDRGWASAPNEAMVGINALAAPIVDGTGCLIGSIALLDSVQHLQEPPSEAQISKLKAAAAEISQLLGYRAEAARPGMGAGS